MYIIYDNKSAYKIMTKIPMNNLQNAETHAR